MNPQITGIYEKQGPVALDQAIESEFTRLADAWEMETRFMSNTTLMCQNWHYQCIIGLGVPVLPFIFKRLEEKGGHWFWALGAITGAESIIPEKFSGNVAQMTEHWLAWGRERHYL